MSNKQEKLNALLRNNFSAFIKKVFQSTSPGGPYQHAWYLDAIAYKLELIRQGKIRRLIVNLPPRCLKSTAVAIALPAFLHGHDPTLRIITVSYSSILAEEHSYQTRLVMCEKWYRDLFPATILSPDKKTTQMLKTTANGFRFATSTGATITGIGADIIIIDDLLKPDDAFSDKARG
ncbi:MAG TPA: hypothetical protein VMX97_17445, partial [Hyphomicrobiaceae bacterium]|nr:hypothetical protein [Hyphomicrobiaceae bacterium]